MLSLVRCDWYNDDYPNKAFLRYAYENFDDLSFAEKVEALKSIFDNYYTIVCDEENEKIFIYGHGEMNEADDRKIYEWISGALEG